MTELRPDLEHLLARARRQHEPSAEDAARVRAALAVSLGLPTADPFSAVDVAQAAPSAAPAAGSLPLWLGKIIVGLSLGGLALWAGLPGQRPPRTPRQAAPAAIEIAAPEPVAPSAEHAETTAAVQAAAAPLEPAAPTSERPTLRPARRHRARLSSAPAVAADLTDLNAAPPPETHSSPLGAALRTDPQLTAQATSPASPASQTPTAQAELRLIRAALQALNAHQPERALSLLERHRAEYAGGVLREERAGLRVVALCESGQMDEGRKEGQAFLRSAPRSPLAKRVEVACREEP